MSQNLNQLLNCDWTRPQISTNQNLCCQSGVFYDVINKYAWRTQLATLGWNSRVFVGFSNQKPSYYDRFLRNLDPICLQKPT